MSARSEGDSSAELPELKRLKLVDATEPPRRNYPRFWVEKRGDEAEEEEPVSNDEVNRLLKLLEEDPNKLNEAEQDDLCRSVDVDKIISVAVKWGKEMGMESGEEERHQINKRLLTHPEKLKETQMRLTYTYSIYESALEAALLSCKVKEGVSRSDLEEFFFLSRFLPYKLFARSCIL